MFVLKTLGQLLQSAVPSSGATGDLVELKEGTVWYSIGGSTTGRLQPLFPRARSPTTKATPMTPATTTATTKATLTIRQSSVPFQYLLVVAKAADGDGDGEEDDLENGTPVHVE